jgi:hypothetical protein
LAAEKAAAAQAAAAEAAAEAAAKAAEAAAEEAAAAQAAAEKVAAEKAAAEEAAAAQAAANLQAAQALAPAAASQLLGAKSAFSSSKSVLQSEKVVKINSEPILQTPQTSLSINNPPSLGAVTNKLDKTAAERVYDEQVKEILEESAASDETEPRQIIISSDFVAPQTPATSFRAPCDMVKASQTLNAMQQAARALQGAVKVSKDPDLQATFAISEQADQLSSAMNTASVPSKLHAIQLQQLADKEPLPSIKPVADVDRVLAIGTNATGGETETEMEELLNTRRDDDAIKRVADSAQHAQNVVYFDKNNLSQAVGAIMYARSGRALLVLFAERAQYDTCVTSSGEPARLPEVLGEREDLNLLSETDKSQVMTAVKQIQNELTQQARDQREILRLMVVELEKAKEVVETEIRQNPGAARQTVYHAAQLNFKRAEARRKREVAETVLLRRDGDDAIADKQAVQIAKELRSSAEVLESEIAAMELQAIETGAELEKYHKARESFQLAKFQASDLLNAETLKNYRDLKEKIRNAEIDHGVARAKDAIARKKFEQTYALKAVDENQEDKVLHNDSESLCRSYVTSARNANVSIDDDLQKLSSECTDTYGTVKVTESELKRLNLEMQRPDNVKISKLIQTQTEFQTAERVRYQVPTMHLEIDGVAVNNTSTQRAAAAVRINQRIYYIPVSADAMEIRTSANERQSLLMSVRGVGSVHTPFAVQMPSNKSLSREITSLTEIAVQLQVYSDPDCTQKAESIAVQLQRGGTIESDAGDQWKACMVREQLNHDVQALLGDADPDAKLLTCLEQYKAISQTTLEQDTRFVSTDGQSASMVLTSSRSVPRLSRACTPLLTALRQYEQIYHELQRLRSQKDYYKQFDPESILQFASAAHQREDMTHDTVERTLGAHARYVLQPDSVTFTEKLTRAKANVAKHVSSNVSKSLGTVFGLQEADVGTNISQALDTAQDYIASAAENVMSGETTERTLEAITTALEGVTGNNRTDFDPTNVVGSLFPGSVRESKRLQEIAAQKGDTFDDRCGNWRDLPTFNSTSRDMGKCLPVQLSSIPVSTDVDSIDPKMFRKDGGKGWLRDFKDYNSFKAIAFPLFIPDKGATVPDVITKDPQHSLQCDATAAGMAAGSAMGAVTGVVLREGSKVAVSKGLQAGALGVAAAATGVSATLGLPALVGAAALNYKLGGIGAAAKRSFGEESVLTQAASAVENVGSSASQLAENLSSKIVSDRFTAASAGAVAGAAAYSRFKASTCVARYACANVLELHKMIHDPTARDAEGRVTNFVRRGLILAAQQEQIEIDRKLLELDRVYKENRGRKLRYEDTGFWQAQKTYDSLWYQTQQKAIIALQRYPDIADLERAMDKYFTPQEVAYIDLWYNDYQKLIAMISGCNDGSSLKRKDVNQLMLIANNMTAAESLDAPTTAHWDIATSILKGVIGVGFGLGVGASIGTLGAAAGLMSLGAGSTLGTIVGLSAYFGPLQKISNANLLPLLTVILQIGRTASCAMIAFWVMAMLLTSDSKMDISMWRIFRSFAQHALTNSVSKIAMNLVRVLSGEQTYDTSSVNVSRARESCANWTISSAFKCLPEVTMYIFMTLGTNLALFGAAYDAASGSGAGDVVSKICSVVFVLAGNMLSFGFQNFATSTLAVKYYTIFMVLGTTAVQNGMAVLENYWNGTNSTVKSVAETGLLYKFTNDAYACMGIGDDNNGMDLDQCLSVGTSFAIYSDLAGGVVSQLSGKRRGGGVVAWVATATNHPLSKLFFKGNLLRELLELLYSIVQNKVAGSDNAQMFSGNDSNNGLFATLTNPTLVDKFVLRVQSGALCSAVSARKQHQCQRLIKSLTKAVDLYWFVKEGTQLAADVAMLYSMLQAAAHSSRQECLAPSWTTPWQSIYTDGATAFAEKRGAQGVFDFVDRRKRLTDFLGYEHDTYLHGFAARSKCGRAWIGTTSYVNNESKIIGGVLGAGVHASAGQATQSDMQMLAQVSQWATQDANQDAAFDEYKALLSVCGNSDGNQKNCAETVGEDYEKIKSGQQELTKEYLKSKLRSGQDTGGKGTMKARNKPTVFSKNQARVLDTATQDLLLDDSRLGEIDFTKELPDADRQYLRSQLRLLFWGTGATRDSFEETEANLDVELDAIIQNMQDSKNIAKAAVELQQLDGLAQNNGGSGIFSYMFSVFQPEQVQDNLQTLTGETSESSQETSLFGRIKSWFASTDINAKDAQKRAVKARELMGITHLLKFDSRWTDTSEPSTELDTVLTQGNLISQLASKGMYLSQAAHTHLQEELGRTLTESNVQWYKPVNEITLDYNNRALQALAETARWNNEISAADLARLQTYADDLQNDQQFDVQQLLNVHKGRANYTQSLFVALGAAAVGSIGFLTYKQERELADQAEAQGSYEESQRINRLAAVKGAATALGVAVNAAAYQSGQSPNLYAAATQAVGSTVSAMSLGYNQRDSLMFGLLLGTPLHLLNATQDSIVLTQAAASRLAARKTANVQDLRTFYSTRSRPSEIFSVLTQPKPTAQD